MRPEIYDTLLIRFVLYHVEAAVGDQGLGQFYCAVGLLEIFQHGDDGPGDGDGGSVQHVYEAVFAIVVFVADIEAAGLVVGAV
jgi:hypothetical protein